MSKNTRIAVLSAGGDCPGINHVILKARESALAAGVELVGIRKGYSGLSGDAVDLLSLPDDLPVTALRTRKSVIGMSRFSLFGHAERAKHAANLLKQAGITHLIAIGGDDTLRSTDQMADEARKMGFNIGIVHCPKTIDNDFPFVNQSIQTFGFDTAAQKVADTLTSIDQGASMLTCIMGRYTGYLAAEGAKRAGLKFCFAPELFTGRRISLIDLMDFTERAITACKGRPIAYAEGLWEVLDTQSQKYILSKLPSANDFMAFCSGIGSSSTGLATSDEHGHTEYGNFPWFEIWANLMAQRTAEKIRYKLIGYETRIEAPNPFDQALTSTIGAGAVDLLLQGQTRLTVYGTTSNGGKSFDMQTIGFDDLPRDTHGKIQIRKLDINHPNWSEIMSATAALLQ